MKLRKLGIAASIAAVVSFPATAFASGGNPTLYSSLPPSVGANLLPSEGVEAYSFSELGNQITLTRSAKIASVTIGMQSWGCGKSGTWGGDNCVTTPGTKFTEPITLNIYNAPASDPQTAADTPGNGLPGSRILSITKTFSIPYRPSANNAKCQGTSPYFGAGAFYDAALGQCFPGLATNVTFNLASLHVTLPKNIVFGIAYDTSDYGYAPYGDANMCNMSTTGCPYDALNIALSNDPTNLNVGSDPYTGGMYQNALAGDYCDHGAAGSGTFRFDSPSTPSCWGIANPYGGTQGYYIPAIQFDTT
jgi:hypothetical protein